MGFLKEKGIAIPKAVQVLKKLQNKGIKVELDDLIWGVRYVNYYCIYIIFNIYDFNILFKKLLATGISAFY